MDSSFSGSRSAMKKGRSRGRQGTVSRQVDKDDALPHLVGNEASTKMPAGRWLRLFSENAKAEAQMSA